MKKIFFIFILAALSATVYCEQRMLNIICTTDVHGRMDTPQGGWLKTASVIKTLRKILVPDGNMLLIDCGDSFQGTFAGALFKGRMTVDIMNLLGYDAWVPGNHEFDFGIENFTELTRLSKADVLAANIIWHLKPRPKTIPWKIYTKNGIRTAVIGMTLSYLDEKFSWEQKGNFSIITFKKALDEIITQVMDSKPDMIILALHDSMYSSMKENNLWDIAKEFPQINLILGGHSHEIKPGEKVFDSWFAQAGKHGENILFTTAVVDTAKHKVVSIASNLISVAQTTPDSETQKTVEAFLLEAKEKAQRNIGKTISTISPLAEKELNAPLNQLFCEAMAAKTKAEIAFHDSNQKTFLRGTLTENDIFRMLPYENTIGILELNKAEIKAIIEEQFRKRGKGHFQTPWGIYVTVDSKGKVTDILFRDRTPWQDENKRIKTAFSSYILSGAGSRFPVLKEIAEKADVNPSDSGIFIRDALKDYIKKNSPLEIHTEKWLNQK